MTSSQTTSFNSKNSHPMVRVVLITLTIAYPFAIYFGIQHWGIQHLAILLLALGLLHLITAGKGKKSSWFLAAISLLLAIWSWLHDSSFGLKLYPVLVNLAMLTLFAWSLYHPPTIIERIARMQEPDLPQEGVNYTKRVTQVWCLFFIINASISAATCLLASDKLWALYNGLIAYILMALLFSIEWIIRQRIKGNFND